ncbi:MAG TPA: ankyrin repeat domain-containing protein [Verrucomicrobiae bacterium]|nr:ankyrin repeat domain-containing protein [Verrucomicrobiae bacterium]
MPQASTVKTKPRLQLSKTAIISIVIGLLVLTNAVAAFFWWRDANKLPPPRHPWRTSAGPVATSPQPASTDDTLLQNANRAIINGDFAQLKQILDEHPNIINQHYGPGRATLLIAAASWGRADAVAELLKRKADVNARNRFNSTPLFACINNRGTKEIVGMLLDAKADFTIPNNNGMTPLALALKKNRQDMADLLKQHGATK